MRLEILAAGYAETAACLEKRAAAIRRAIKYAVGSEYVMLRQDLTLLQRQVHEARTLAELCARYYEPDYHLPAEFTLQEDKTHGKQSYFNGENECSDADGPDGVTARGSDTALP